MSVSHPRLVAIALSAVTAMSMVPVLIKYTQANIETIGTARLLISLVILSPLLLFRKGFSGLRRRDWLWLVFAGLCFGIHWWTYFYAIKVAGAATGAIAMSTFGIHLLLLNWLIHRQTLKPVDMLLVAVCAFGCYLVIPAPSLNDRTTLGFLVGVFSAMLYGAMPLIHRRMIHLSTLVRTWGQFAFAGLFFLLLWPETNWQLAAPDWWSLLVLGTVCTLFAHGLWVKASSELPGLLTGSIHYLYPPMTMVQSWLFLNERITGGMIAGALMIISANLVLIASPWWRLQRRRTGP